MGRLHMCVSAAPARSARRDTDVCIVDHTAHCEGCKVGRVVVLQPLQSVLILRAVEVEPGVAADGRAGAARAGVGGAWLAILPGRVGVA